MMKTSSNRACLVSCLLKWKHTLSYEKQLSSGLGRCEIVGE